MLLISTGPCVLTVTRRSGSRGGDMIRAVLDAQRAGDRFILWTCRIGERLEEAVEWSAAQGLTFDAVNDNLPDMIALYGNNCRKVFADGYIDDRNVRDLLGVEP